MCELLIGQYTFDMEMVYMCLERPGLGEEKAEGRVMEIIK